MFTASCLPVSMSVLSLHLYQCLMCLQLAVCLYLFLCVTVVSLSVSVSVFYYCLFVCIHVFTVVCSSIGGEILLAEPVL